MFFVGTGVGLDVTALFHSGRAILGVPIFLLAPLLVRGLPAVLYAPIVGGTHRPQPAEVFFRDPPTMANGS